MFQILTNGTFVALPTKAALARGDVTLSWWRDAQTTIQAADVSARTAPLTDLFYKEYRKHRCRAIIYRETKFKNVIIMKRTRVRTVVNYTYIHVYILYIGFFCVVNNIGPATTLFHTINVSEVNIQKTI